MTSILCMKVKKITMVNSTKFLGLTLDNTLSWRPHIDTIAPKLSSAGFALRIVKPPLVTGVLENGILPFDNDLRNNILGELPS